MLTTFFIILFNKGLTKIIHQNTRSNHATPIDQTTKGDHANKALFPDHAKAPHQLGAGSIAYPDTPSRQNESAHPD
jgi:hypothetical protein